MIPPNYSGATSDLHLVEIWLTGRPHSTARGYRRDALKFLSSLPKGMGEATVADIAAWANSLDGSDGYKARRIIAIKSLLSFAEKTGYIIFNVGAAVLRVPKQRGRLHERIMEEDTVRAMIEVAEEGRDRTLIKFLYASGCRVAEAVGINFADLGRNTVTLHGKGGRTRTVQLQASVVSEVKMLRDNGMHSRTPVFRSCRGLRLSTRDAQRIVEKARGEVTTLGVTPHWMRHAHATHSLDRGAPLHKLQKQLGHANIATTSAYLHVRNGDGTSEFLNLD